MKNMYNKCIALILCLGFVALHATKNYFPCKLTIPATYYAYSRTVEVDGEEKVKSVTFQLPAKTFKYAAWQEQSPKRIIGADKNKYQCDGSVACKNKALIMPIIEGLYKQWAAYQLSINYDYLSLRPTAKATVVNELWNYAAALLDAAGTTYFECAYPNDPKKAKPLDHEFLAEYLDFVIR